MPWSPAPCSPTLFVAGSTLRPISHDWPVTCWITCTPSASNAVVGSSYPSSRIAWRTIGRWSSGAIELISPATTTTPDLASTSQATRLRASCSRYASRMESAMKSHTLSGCPSVTDSEVSTAWRSVRTPPSPRFSSSGNAAALLMASGRAGNRGVAAPHTLAGRLQAERQRAAGGEGVLGQHLVAPAAGLDHVGGAQREADALLLPAGQVHRKGDPPQAA